MYRYNSNVFVCVCLQIVVGYFRLGAPSSLLVNLLVKICYAIAYQSLAVCRGIIYQDMVCTIVNFLPQHKNSVIADVFYFIFIFRIQYI